MDYVLTWAVIPKTSRFSTVMRQLSTPRNNQILVIPKRRTPYIASASITVGRVIHKRGRLSTDMSHFSTSYVMQIFT
jgi:hypothetical protein